MTNANENTIPCVGVLRYAFKYMVKEMSAERLKSDGFLSRHQLYFDPALTTHTRALAHHDWPRFEFRRVRTVVLVQMPCRL